MSTGRWSVRLFRYTLVVTSRWMAGRMVRRAPFVYAVGGCRWKPSILDNKEN